MANLSEQCGNTSTNATDTFNYMLIVGLITTSTVCVLGAIGNLLTVLAIVLQTRLPKSKRYIEKVTSNCVLIVNLAIADFFYCVISLPVMFTIYWNLHYGALIGLPHTFCKWAAFIRYTNAIGEWTTLGLMALGRCVTIYRYRRRLSPGKAFTPRRTIIYCVVLWVCASLCQIPTLTQTYGEFGYNNATVKCDFMPVIPSDYTITPRVFFFALESAVPCCLILVGYIIILVQVYSSDNFWRRTDSLTVHTQTLMALRRSRTTSLVVQLLSIYLVCVIPICIYNVYIKEICLGTQRNQILGIGIYCIYFVQYSLNNILYVLRNNSYRQAYKQLFLYVCCKPIPNPPRTTVLLECYPNPKRLKTLSETISQPKTPQLKKIIADIKIKVPCFVDSTSFKQNISDPFADRKLKRSVKTQCERAKKMSMKLKIQKDDSSETLESNNNRIRKFSGSVNRNCRGSRERLRRTFSV